MSAEDTAGDMRNFGCLTVRPKSVIALLAINDSRGCVQSVCVELSNGNSITIAVQKDAEAIVSYFTTSDIDWPDCFIELPPQAPPVQADG